MSEVEKVTECATCGGPVEQSGEGRPRTYCDITCRRVAEYRIRRLMTLLATVEKIEQGARLELVDPMYRTSTRHKQIKAWQAEIDRLEERLTALLTPATDHDERSHR